VDLSEHIETIKLHVRSLCDRLTGVTVLNDKDRASLAAVMLWCDRLAERCEVMAEARGTKVAK
jgi:hypothetical protein